MLVSKKSQIKSMINTLYIHQDSLGTNSILIQISDQKIQILHTQQQSDPKININKAREAFIIDLITLDCIWSSHNIKRMIPCYSAYMYIQIIFTHCFV